jgi:hypothetical protein
MKGVVFTEFLEMVEDRFSPDMADRIIEGAGLASGGVYTTVGTYDHREMKYFEDVSSSFDFLQRIDHYIHVEVGKLYPDAELPSFDCDASQPGCLHLTYRSSRPFAALAEGLIRGCVAHYGEAVDIAVEDLSDGTGTAARFLLTKRGAAP